MSVVRIYAPIAVALLSLLLSVLSYRNSRHNFERGLLIGAYQDRMERLAAALGALYAPVPPGSSVEQLQYRHSNLCEVLDIYGHLLPEQVRESATHQLNVVLPHLVTQVASLQQSGRVGEEAGLTVVDEYMELVHSVVDSFREEQRVTSQRVSAVLGEGVTREVSSAAWDAKGTSQP